MQDYTQHFFGAWRFLLIDENMYLVSHCYVKKAVKFVVFLSTNNFIYIFLIQKTENI